jgi:two-component system response regulator HydG
VVTVRLPPLRERREDVPLLAAAFLQGFAERNRRPVTGFSDAALQALAGHDWPGNVRELQHAVERAVVLCRGEVVDVGDLPDPVRAAVPGRSLPPSSSLSIPVGTPLEEIERIVIRETLRHTRGDKNLAARLLKVAPRTIYRKLDRDGEGRLLEVPAEDLEEPGRR